MAVRPIFVPVPEHQGYVRQVDFDIPWAGGFAQTQKKKNVNSLHEAAREAGYSPLLEISSKAEEIAGRHLSAFHLRIETGVGRVPIENVFQGSKIFQRGGPFTDLYEVEPQQAKRDPRLRSSGALMGFSFDDLVFPLHPKSVFYDWLYLSAIFPHRRWLKNRIDGEMEYAGFTDIEFNPAKSVNCQARSCALFVSLMREDKLEKYLESPSTFMFAMTEHAVDNFDDTSNIRQPRFRTA